MHNFSHFPFYLHARIRQRKFHCIRKLRLEYSHQISSDHMIEHIFEISMIAIFASLTSKRLLEN